MELDDLPISIETNYSLLEGNLQEVHHSEYYDMYKYKVINTEELHFFESDIKTAHLYYNANILIGAEMYLTIEQKDKFIKTLLQGSSSLEDFVDFYSLGFTGYQQNIDGVDIKLSYDEEKDIFYLEYNRYERWFGGVFNMNKFENYSEEIHYYLECNNNKLEFDSFSDVEEWLEDNKRVFHNIAKTNECRKWSKWVNKNQHVFPCVCHTRNKDCVFAEIYYKLNKLLEKEVYLETCENAILDYYSVKADSQSVETWLEQYEELWNTVFGFKSEIRTHLSDKTYGSHKTIVKSLIIIEDFYSLYEQKAIEFKYVFKPIT